MSTGYFYIDALIILALFYGVVGLLGLLGFISGAALGLLAKILRLIQEL